MRTYEPKPLFLERMKSLLEDKDFEKYTKEIMSDPLRSIRVNTLKISPDELKKRLEKNQWIIKQPFEEFPEIMIVESNLEPGELGRSLEHLIGYYYVQDISSMLPVLSLNPKEDETILDSCASPGSKTTQIASRMKNTGTLIANEVSLGRIKILASNLERCGVTNTIITKNNAESILKNMKPLGFKINKILIDAPCSGEGTIISNKKTLLMWNIKNVFNLSKKQKNMLKTGVELLEDNGEIVYSTCTHSPEENEEVIDFILNEFKNIKLEKPTIPKELKARPGILEWQGKKYSKEIKKCVRIYPHDNNTEGFFIAKLRKVK